MPDRINRRRFLTAAGALFMAPVHAQEKPRPEQPYFASALPWSGTTLEGFRLSTPEAQGFDSARLAAMTRFIEGSPQRVFSMMIARNGNLVYEMLAGDLSRDASHYVMSVTKSLTSAVVGVAIDRGIILSEDQPIGELLPAELFGSAGNLRDKAGIPVRHVLNMSALDVPHIVGNTDPAVMKNYFGWVKAENRVRYALAQRKVERPMNVMDYTDLDLSLINGVIHYKTRKTVLDFANENLFFRMDFRNQEWMGQDSSGIDLGGYGIRLRPIDMLKFGQLYLQRGLWNGKPLLNPGWIDKAYVSQIAPRNDHRRFFSGYSNYWWHGRHQGAPKNIMANGWKGQRISIFPETGLVVALTGVIESDESGFYEELISRHVLYSMRAESLNQDSASFDELQVALVRMRKKIRGSSPLSPGCVRRKKTRRAGFPGVREIKKRVEGGGPISSSLRARPFSDDQLAIAPLARRRDRIACDAPDQDPFGLAPDGSRSLVRPVPRPATDQRRIPGTSAHACKRCAAGRRRPPVIGCCNASPRYGG